MKFNVGDTVFLNCHTTTFPLRPYHLSIADTSVYVEKAVITHAYPDDPLYYVETKGDSFYIQEKDLYPTWEEAADALEETYLKELEEKRRMLSRIRTERELRRLEERE